MRRYSPRPWWHVPLSCCQPRACTCATTVWPLSTARDPLPKGSSVLSETFPTRPLGRPRTPPTGPQPREKASAAFKSQPLLPAGSCPPPRTEVPFAHRFSRILSDATLQPAQVDLVPNIRCPTEAPLPATDHIITPSGGLPNLVTYRPQQRGKHILMSWTHGALSNLNHQAHATRCTLRRKDWSTSKSISSQ